MKLSVGLSALAASLALFSAPSFAAYGDFCVNESIVPGYGVAAPILGWDDVVNGPTTGCVSDPLAQGHPAKGFTADYLNGKYAEKFRINNDFSFDATIVANLSAIFRNEGEDQVLPIALGQLYQLYAVVTATGAFDGSEFTPTNSTLSLYLSTGTGANLGLSAIDDGSLAFALDPNDYLLGTATYASGSGVLTPSNLRFQLDFNQFTLTDATTGDANINGDSFFIAPRPFHLSVFTDGDISRGSIGGTGFPLPGLYTIGAGDVSAVFNEVPEPTTLALAGLALVGLGVARRRKA